MLKDRSQYADDDEEEDFSYLSDDVDFESDGDPMGGLSFEQIPDKLIDSVE